MSRNQLRLRPALVAALVLAFVAALPSSAAAARPATEHEEAAMRQVLGIMPAEGCSLSYDFTVSTVSPAWSLVTITDTSFNCQSGLALLQRANGSWIRRWSGSDGSWTDRILSCGTVRDLAPGRVCDSRTYLTNGISPGDASLVVRPRSIAFGAAHALTGIRWTTWGARVARGTGVCTWNDRVRVNITATGLTKLNGKKRYRKVVARHASGANAGDLVARCSIR